MSLDGLRAWIGVVERKLTMRTRVFLVLVAIAIGSAGTGIYLAIDARDSAVSETDLQTVRDELAAGAAGGDLTQLEAEVEALRAEVETLQSESGAGKNGGAAAPQEPGSDGAISPFGSDGGVTPLPQSATPLPQPQSGAQESGEPSSEDAHK